MSKTSETPTCPGIFPPAATRAPPMRGRTMQRARRTGEQIIGILAQHDAGAKCADLCCKQGMSEGAFYAWKAKCSGMTVPEAPPAFLEEQREARPRGCRCGGRDGACPRQMRNWSSMDASRRLSERWRAWRATRVMADPFRQPCRSGSGGRLQTHRPRIGQPERTRQKGPDRFTALSPERESRRSTETDESRAGL